jgi:hypothetical protein
VRNPHRVPSGRAVAATVLLLTAALVAGIPTAAAAPPPTLPLAFDRELLSNLSAPSVGPGGSTAVSFRLHDPASFGGLVNLVLTFEVYALNGYPGDAVGPVPVSNAPVLENASASGAAVSVTLASLAKNASYTGSVTFVTSAATPAGTYAISTELTFVENGTPYVLKSRGWFNESAWENATVEANGTPTVDPARLNVSGILPETAVYVAPSDWSTVFVALLAVGFVLVGVGAWLYFRKGPGSRSGAARVPAPGATNAPSAFGSNRSSPGDSRSN